MANTDVARFFEAAYNDRDLQGALHAALCKLAPEVIVEMAATKGYKFTSEDLQEAASKPADHELTDQEMAAVAGGGIVPAASRRFRISRIEFLGRHAYGLRNETALTRRLGRRALPPSPPSHHERQPSA
jgi:predicted ribosomally synthesized peptide with nif11-like leader